MNATTNIDVEGHKIVSPEEWLAERRKLLEKEKEVTHARDELARKRLELPWVRVEKDYVFDGPDGKVHLADLFAGRTQLIVYHFMYGPDWEEGCPGCSFLADHIDGARVHLEHHDISIVAVSRAPLAKLQAFEKRMGWNFRWYSSLESDFNFDFYVSYRREELDKGEVFHNFKMQKLRSEEQPGTSVFFKDKDGTIYHTYSSYERGGEELIGTYDYLDIAPKGRNEETPMDWLRHHDKYED